MNQVTIYTDGACSGNPGPGGWAAVVTCGEHRKTLTGHADCTTNNRMELTAVIEALKILKFRCDVTVYSDSTYVVYAHTKGWLNTWRNHNFIKKDNTQVPNTDLWIELVKLENCHNITWVKVQGHNGIPENEYCDKLAKQACY